MPFFLITTNTYFLRIHITTDNTRLINRHVVSGK
jgi:hypothetical protein